jgi:hypothetical protein
MPEFKFADSTNCNSTNIGDVVWWQPVSDEEYRKLKTKE